MTVPHDHQVAGAERREGDRLSSAVVSCNCLIDRGVRADPANGFENVQQAMQHDRIRQSAKEWLHAPGQLTGPSLKAMRLPGLPGSIFSS